MDSDKDCDTKNGDLFLIRHMKQKPIIWNANHPDYHDREKRDWVFRELSKKTTLDPYFLKRRWITLRERYVKDLRCQLLKNSTKSNYKYSQELSYLKKHVKLKIQNNDIMSKVDDNNFEFEITDEDLRLDENDEDLNVLLMQFDEDVLNENFNKEINDIPNENLMKIPELEHQTPTKMPAEAVVNPFVPLNQVPETSPVVVQTSQNDIRNEDVIFGELIVSQLMKITDETKKRSIKRSILDLFF